EYWAKTLASQGINCIRFHHTDSDWANCFFKHDSSGKKIVFDEKSFERFDKFFYELKKAGIYSNINLLTGRTIHPDSKNGLPAELEKVADWKDRHCYGFWNEIAKKEQQAYAEKILNHKNPYTGLTYAQDPAVAFVEINNENSMTKGFLDNVLDRYPKTLSQELDVLWTDFLLEKGLNYNTLAQKYNQSQSSGENLLSGVTTLEQHSGAKADLSENNGHTKINIKSESDILKNTFPKNCSPLLTSISNHKGICTYGLSRVKASLLALPSSRAYLANSTKLISNSPSSEACATSLTFSSR
ncbi:MAG: hypothetical protein J6P37_04625, partial [Lachnospiraceae bacterium]|nr:hypothetical protein [Lachnospiraceae bacterium]